MSKPKKEKPLSLPPENDKLKLTGSSRTSGQESNSKSDFNWADVLHGISFVGAAASFVYLSAQGIDQTVNELLESDTITATSKLLQIVPDMKDEIWSSFTIILSNKAQYNHHAENVYNIAIYIRQSNQKINEIFQDYSIQDSITIINGLLANRNDFEQAIFAALLTLKSQTDIKAKTVLNDIKNSSDKKKE